MVWVLCVAGVVGVPASKLFLTLDAIIQVVIITGSGSGNVN